MVKFIFKLEIIRSINMQSFIGWLEQQSRLYQELLALRPAIAQAAQKVYNEWEQEDECDVGGICDEVAREIGEVIVQHIHDANVTDGGQEGDDHAWVVVYNQTESYGVDISPHVYEVGSGYCWRKIPGVIFTIKDVEIWNLGIHPSNFQER